MKFPDFYSPWLFLLLIPAVAAAWIFLKKKQPSVIFPDLSAVTNGKKRFLSYKMLIPFVLICISLALIILALTRPREGLEEIKQRSNGVDIIIALDISGSMSSIDLPSEITTRGQLTQALNTGKIAPRLNVAKQEIEKFIKARPSDRIGLIVFAQQPYLACPPTLDHGRLLESLKKFQPGDIGNQTGIAGPVASGIRRLKDSDAKRKIVVLFTDGANNVAAQISPIQSAKLAKEYGIIIYTVGIGSSQSIYPQETPFGVQFVPVQNDFDEPLLKEISTTTDGKYYRAEDIPSMKAAMQSIDKLEKTTFEQQVLINWRELAFPLITVALGSLLLAFLLENTVFLKAP